MTQFRFKVVNGQSQFYTDWYDEGVNSSAVDYVQTLRASYPNATFSVERRTGMSGSYPVISNNLTNDLQLNGFNLIGALNSPGLLIDGGVI